MNVIDISATAAIAKLNTQLLNEGLHIYKLKMRGVWGNSQIQVTFPNGNIEMYDTRLVYLNPAITVAEMISAGHLHKPKAGESRPFHDIQYQLNCLVYDFNRLKFQCDKLVDAIRLELEDELKK